MQVALEPRESSEYTGCSTRFDEVFRVCVDIAQPPHIEAGSIVLVMSTTSMSIPLIACTFVHMCVYMCVYDPMEGHTVLAAIHHF